MKLIAIMPNADGVDEIIKAIGNELGFEISLRTNYTQAKKRYLNMALL